MGLSRSFSSDFPIRGECLRCVGDILYSFPHRIIVYVSNIMNVLRRRGQKTFVLFFSMMLLSAHTALVSKPSSSATLKPGSKPASRTSGKVDGVWRITKVLSVLGPTVTLYLYNKFYNLCEKHGPILSARVQAAMRALEFDSDSRMESGRLRSISQSKRHQENPFVLKIANEVIRITNVRLRERAVVSRIQMDDDQYELSGRHTASDVVRITGRVLEEVLNDGSGAILNEKEKSAVRAMIRSSLAQYRMDHTLQSSFLHVA